MMQKNFALSTKSPLVYYDALQDKHASFYFNGHGIKRHLKKLKNALSKQPYQKGYKQYAEMLNHKLQELEKSNGDIHRKSKPYVQTLKQSSLQKLRKIHYLASNGSSANYLTQEQENHQIKPGNSSQNLPNISKFKNSQQKKLPGFRNDDRSEDKNHKSISLLSKYIQKKEASINLSKQRSKNSVQGSSKLKKDYFGKQGKITEVKHEEFMSFLKKREEEILKASKVILPTKKPSLIKEEASFSEES